MTLTNESAKFISNIWLLAKRFFFRCRNRMWQIVIASHLNPKRTSSHNQLSTKLKSGRKDIMHAHISLWKINLKKENFFLPPMIMCFVWCRHAKNSRKYLWFMYGFSWIFVLTVLENFKHTHSQFHIQIICTMFKWMPAARVDNGKFALAVCALDKTYWNSATRARACVCMCRRK